MNRYQIVAPVVAIAVALAFNVTAAEAANPPIKCSANKVAKQVTNRNGKTRWKCVKPGATAQEEADDAAFVPPATTTTPAAAAGQTPAAVAAPASVATAGTIAGAAGAGAPAAPAASLNEPVVAFEPYKQPVGRSDLKITCLDAPEGVCPVVKYKGMTTWAYSFLDNRVSFELVTYNDATGAVASSTTSNGARYVRGITVDKGNKTVTFLGQATGAVSAPWWQLAAEAPPPAPVVQTAPAIPQFGTAPQTTGTSSINTVGSQQPCQSPTTASGNSGTALSGTLPQNLGQSQQPVCQ
jgi:hypothetical protein